MLHTCRYSIYRSRLPDPVFRPHIRHQNGHIPSTDGRPYTTELDIGRCLVLYTLYYIYAVYAVYDICCIWYNVYVVLYMRYTLCTIYGIVYIVYGSMRHLWRIYVCSMCVYNICNICWLLGMLIHIRCDICGVLSNGGLVCRWVCIRMAIYYIVCIYF